MLLAYDKQTGETRSLSEISLSPSELLVLPDESAEHLQTLQLEWEKEFPATSQTTKRLRDLLIDADWQLHRDRAAFQNLQQLFHLTNLPVHFWPPEAQTQLQLLKKQHSQSQRTFTRALAALHSASKSAESKASSKPILESPPPPPPKPPIKGDLYQTVRVTVEEGKTVTKVDFTAAFWLEKALWNEVRGFVRQFDFAKGHIPDEYSWVLTHNGITYDPSIRFLITYPPEEFKRLCELELDTGSAHLLDGERTDYDRQDYGNTRI